MLGDVIKPGEHVLCAVSGGADSVALLLLLREKADNGEIKLTAAHFDHKIRVDSGEDADFVEAMCRRLHVPLVKGSEDIPALVKLRGEGLETVARDARRAFLEKAREEIGADVIATAHHKNDQAETVLMHLFRGAGVSGAAGIRPRAGRWVRPLLDWNKAEIQGFLEEKGQDWRTDETNFQPCTPRNRLRSAILPEILKEYPGAVDALARHAQIAAEENEYFDKLTGNFLRENGRIIDPGLYALNRVQADPALVHRALHHLYPKKDRGFILRISDLYFSGSGTVCAHGIKAECAGNSLYLTDSQISAADLLGRIVYKPAENRPIYDNGNRQVLRGDIVQGSMLRTREDGDWIRPLGMRGRKSLSDYLTDRRIARPLRDRLPLLAKGSEILWVIGVGISDDAALKTSGDTAIELTYIPKNQEDSTC